MSATTTGITPTAALTVTVTSTQQGAGAYVLASSTSNGIASASIGGGGSTATITINFQPPASLGAGVFNDTVTIQVCLDVKCTQPVTGSPLTVPVSYTVTAGSPATATPTLSALSPTSATAGGGAFTLVLSGGDFAPTSVVQWNGQARTTSYTSPTSISAQINASDLTAAHQVGVSVSNTSSGGGVSNVLQFAVNAPAPVVSTVSPATVSAGGSAFVLTITGSGFDTSAQVYWGGSYRNTQYLSPTKLTAQITADDIASTGNFSVTVVNTDGPSTASNAVPVSVVIAPLSLTTLSPASVTVGGQGFVETVIGTGFNATSTVQWNGSARNTTFISTTELLAQITASDIASASSASVTVTTPGSNAATSSALPVMVAPPSVDAVSFLINPQHTGAINFANVVAPTALPQASTWTAQLDGTPSYALIAGGRVFVTVSLSGGASELVALNATTGAKLWGPIALSGNANAAYENGKVFVLTATNGSAAMLSAFDAVSGTQLWVTSLTSQWMFTGPPTAANGYVYVTGAGDAGTLYAVDESAGTLAWTGFVQNGNNSSPSVTADGVYVSFPCQTYDFRPMTGELVWNNANGCEGGGGATGLVANGVAYSPNGIAGFSGMTFNAETGAVMSSYSAGAPPAIGSQMGYFVLSGSLRGITPDGTIQWSFSGDGSLQTAPIVVNNYVFVEGNSGNLYALDAGTGNQLWQVKLASPVASNSSSNTLLPATGLSAGDGMLVVPVGSTLVAYTLSTSP